MSDWIDRMTPEQARAWMAAPVEIEEVPFSRGSTRGRQFRQKNPLTIRDVSRIAEKAKE